MSSALTAARQLLVAWGAAKVPHPGGALLAHLERTAAQLAAWGGEQAWVAAGLCHAAYGTEGFPQALVGLADRQSLAEVIGQEAEAIVYAYCGAARADGPAGGRRQGLVHDRFTGRGWRPSVALTRALAELSVANELDILAHGALAPEDARELLRWLGPCAPQLSRGALDTYRLACRDHGVQWPPSVVPDSCGPAPRPDSELSFLVTGTTEASPHPVVVWVHGGAPPEWTWSRQLSWDVTAAEHWFLYRRGYGPSAPALRQDWAQDGRDLLRLLPKGCHIVSHSYGGVGALVAAAQDPERVASLTLVEPPLFAFAANDPAVAEAARLGRVFADGPADEDRRAFLRLAGMPFDHPEAARLERWARGMHDPSEALPNLAALLRRRLPVLVVSGGHAPGMERLCQLLSGQLHGRATQLVGYGHAAQRHPAFRKLVLAFIAGAE